MVKQFTLKNRWNMGLLNWRNKQNKIIIKKNEKVCTTLNYIELLLILTFTVTGCVSFSAFFSLVGIRAGITSSELGLQICVMTAGIKKYKSIIKKKSIMSKLI